MESKVLNNTLLCVRPISRIRCRRKFLIYGLNKSLWKRCTTSCIQGGGTKLGRVLALLFYIRIEKILEEKVKWHNVKNCNDTREKCNCTCKKNEFMGKYFMLCHLTFSSAIFSILNRTSVRTRPNSVDYPVYTNRKAVCHCRPHSKHVVLVYTR